MSLPLIVKVAVEQAEFHFDKLYSYVWPARLGEPTVGLRVLVPFGGGNRKRQAVVMAISAEETQCDRCKPVYERLDETPLYTEEMLQLASWMKERFFCSLYDACRAMIPPGLYMQIKPSYQVTASFLTTDGFSPEESALLSEVARFQDGADTEELERALGAPVDVALLDALVKKGVLTRTEEASRKVGDATVRMVRATVDPTELTERADDVKLTPKQKKVMAVLHECQTASFKEVCTYASVTAAVVQNLAKKGLLEFYDREVLRSPTADTESAVIPPPVFSEEQQAAFDTLSEKMLAKTPSAALLYGVTGSGKTQVYMQLIATALKHGMQALVLVPEISLTPQTVRLFVGRFGRNVAVLHSGLSVGERMDEWKRIRRGEASVVVGTRSAVFAPLDKLGLIVIDEEQEHTYKSENNPRFHARDVARFRCAKHGALLLLASATPSMETYHLAQSGKYTLCKLTSRYGNSRLPDVTTVDMRTDAADDLVFSHTLLQGIEDTLAHKRQAILLLNRRGYNTFLSCHGCGSVLMCPSCSISLTYHMASEQLVCHYCGHTMTPPRECPTCGEQKIRYAGMGTQKIEKELQKRLPAARILRMDADTTVSRYAYEEKFKAFGEGAYDVMIGTQMVAKGLDFPNVGLVGVLAADQALYSDDFRAYETSFSLLTQVIGRAGRREHPGRAIIQTFTPENPVIALAARQDFDGFYEMEIAARKLMHYPPYSSLYQFGFVGKSEEEVRQTAMAFLAALKQGATETGVPMIALNVSPAMVARIAGRYRYKLLVKTRNTAAVRELTAKLLCEFGRHRLYKNVTVFADIDPAVMM